MYGFPLITDENHSSIGLVEKNINEILIKYKIICGVGIIIILNIAKISRIAC